MTIIGLYSVKQDAEHQQDKPDKYKPKCISAESANNAQVAHQTEHTQYYGYPKSYYLWSL